jgi:dimethylamine/trimethylamine dehydrogenase
LSQLSNVEVYLESRLSASELAEFDADAVLIAVGSHWRRDGQGASMHHPIVIEAVENIHTPDDIFAGVKLDGRVLIYDDEHYMMGGALAEKFLQSGLEVTYLTPHAMISSWTVMTDEQDFIQSKLLHMGIKPVFTQLIDRLDSNGLHTRHRYSGETSCHQFDHLVLVTGRNANSELFAQIEIDPTRIEVTRIGDCLVPSSIADAVYSGHKFAREFDEDPATLVCKRERAILQAPPMVGLTSSRRTS